MHRLARTFAIATGALLALSCGGSPAAPSLQNAQVAAPVTAQPARPALSTFTFSVDTSCRGQFPEGLQQRSYSGATDSSYEGVIRLGGNFLISAGTSWNVVYRSTSDGATTLWFHDPPLWEQLDGDSYLLIYGTSNYRSGSEYGEWPFWGRVTFCGRRQPGIYPACAVPEVTCESTRHRVRVTQN